MAVVSMAISAMTTAGFVVLAIAFARRGGDAPVHDVPMIASSALAWGGGFLHAFSVSVNALRRDRTEGIDHLFRSRVAGAGGRGYVVARVGGLALLLALVIGGGTLLTGAGAILASSSIGAIGRTAQATAASVTFALAFAIVIAPIAMAILGTRTRPFGYVGLLLVLVLPEVLGSTVSAIPSEVAELIALPSALAALRSSLAPGTEDLYRFFRALAALLLFSGVAFFFVRRDVALLACERELP